MTLRAGEGAGRRRRGRPPKSEAADTKAALVEAALRLFAQHGYAGTSIRAIAREVGLSESVLYAHFDGKRAIFDAGVAKLGPEGAAAAVGSLDAALADEDPAGFVRSLIANIVEAWDTDDARLFMSLMARDGLTHDPALIAGIQQAVEHVARVFAGWIEDDRIPADLGSPEDLAFALLAPIGQFRVLWLHADASIEERWIAVDRCHRHADFFVKAVLQW